MEIGIQLRNRVWGLRFFQLWLGYHEKPPLFRIYWGKPPWRRKGS